MSDLVSGFDKFFESSTGNGITWLGILLCCPFPQASADPILPHKSRIPKRPVNSRNVSGFKFLLWSANAFSK